MTPSEKHLEMQQTSGIKPGDPVDAISLDNWYIGGYYCGLSANGHYPASSSIISKQHLNFWELGRLDGEGDRLAQEG